MSLQETIEAKKDTQSELDDLLMVLGDVEEKSTKYRERLVELGEEVSDGDDDGEDANKDDGDDGDDGDGQEKAGLVSKP